MNINLRGLKLDAPDDFAADEAVISLRAPMPNVTTPLAMNKQLVVRSNLIVHRRLVAEGATVDMLAGEICAELAAAMSTMENLQTRPFEFKDGARGMLVNFDFAASEHARVRQFQALRLDATLLTTITLSVDATTLNDQALAKWLTVLASASLVESGL